MSDANPGKNRIEGGRPGSVEKALDILLHLVASRTDDQGVTEIADGVGLPKANVHRLLGSLRSRGFVSVHPATRRYRLGPVALSLSAAYLDRLDIRRLARSSLADLSQRTEETVTLSVRTGWTAAYVDEVRPQRDIVMSVVQGEAFPLSSKAFLAFLKTEEEQRYLDNPALPSIPSDEVVDVTSLQQELERIRTRGYAQTRGERDSDAASVAAPVLDHRSAPVAVVSVCGPVDRFWPRADFHAQQLLDNDSHAVASARAPRWRGRRRLTTHTPTGSVRRFCPPTPSLPQIRGISRCR